MISDDFSDANQVGKAMTALNTLQSYIAMMETGVGQLLCITKELPGSLADDLLEASALLSDAANTARSARDKIEEALDELQDMTIRFPEKYRWASQLF